MTESRGTFTIIGDILGETGYSSHTRGLITGMVRAGADVRVETALSAVWDRNKNLTDDIIRAARKPQDMRSPCFMVAQPPYWPFKLSDHPKSFLGAFVFEGDKAPREWARHVNDPRVKAAIAPSQHSRNAGVAGGANPDKLLVIPHGVDAEVFRPLKAAGKGFEPYQDASKCTFVFNKGWARGKKDRSGLDILMRAYREEFTNNEPVRLLVHVNTAYAGKGWNFGQEYNALQLPPGAVIMTIDKQLDWRRLPDLYACGDYVVSSSKAEGFNLTILEGMACGLVPIVPNNGGEQDYVTNDYGIIYDAPHPVPATGDVTYEGVTWREPDMPALRNALRKAYELWEAKKTRSMGDKAVEVARGMTWAKTAERILDASGL